MNEEARDTCDRMVLHLFFVMSVLDLDKLELRHQESG